MDSSPWSNGPITLHTGHVLEVLRGLPAESIQCVVTSPPYWGLRDYRLEPVVWDDPGGCEHKWGEESYKRRSSDGGEERKETTNVGAIGREVPVRYATCPRCGAWRGSLGLEPTPQLYIQHLVTVMREVRRVLRDDGVCFLNLGDSYASQGGPIAAGGGINDILGGKQETQDYNRSRVPPIGLKPKDLVGIPWRVALALQEDGWWLRSDIIWAKPNPMPESVTDRPTRSHEYIFLLTKNERYYYDQEAVREGLAESTLADGRNVTGRHTQGDTEGTKYKEPGAPMPSWYRGNTFVNPSQGRNLRSVWTIPTQPASGVVVHGRRRTTSPDCPVHGYLVSLAPAPVGDALSASYAFDHSPRTDDDPFQEPEDAVLSIPEGRGEHLPDEHVAIDHNKQMSKMGASLEQDETFDVEELSRTEYTRSERRLNTGANDSDGSKSEEDSGVDGKAIGHVGQRASDKFHKQTEWAFGEPPNNCSCHYTPKEHVRIDHYASFPEALVERCILAGTSERGCCPECGAPWERVVERKSMVIARSGRAEASGNRTMPAGTMQEPAEAKTVGWRAACAHADLAPAPCRVLDPFSGAGTVALVAQKLGRRAIGIDLNQKYTELAVKRLGEMPLPMGGG